MGYKTFEIVLGGDGKAAAPRHLELRDNSLEAISTGSSSTRLRGQSPRSTTKGWDGEMVDRTRNGS